MTARAFSAKAAALAALGCLLAGVLPAAAEETGLPEAVREVAIDQRLGENVPADAVLIDEEGRSVRLGDYLGRRPVLLNFVYYECPMLCTLVLNGIVRTLRTMDFEPGREFDIVTVSIDPRETPELARRKKALYMATYGRDRAAAGWHFTTATRESIERLTAAAGFRYTYDQETGQFAHASGIMLLTPQGRLHRYFYGVEYAPRDLRLGVIDAAQGRIGSKVDALLLYCFHYDPVTGRYGLAVMRLVRLSGLGSALAIAGFVAFMLRRDRRRAPAPREAG